jgi:hypothetical protein
LDSAGSERIIIPGNCVSGFSVSVSTETNVFSQAVSNACILYAFKIFLFRFGVLNEILYRGMGIKNWRVLTLTLHTAVVPQ